MRRRKNNFTTFNRLNARLDFDSNCTLFKSSGCLESPAVHLSCFSEIYFFYSQCEIWLASREAYLELACVVMRIRLSNIGETLCMKRVIRYRPCPPFRNHVNMCVTAHYRLRNFPIHFQFILTVSRVSKDLKDSIGIEEKSDDLITIWQGYQITVLPNETVKLQCESTQPVTWKAFNVSSLLLIFFPGTNLIRIIFRDEEIRRSSEYSGDVWLGKSSAAWTFHRIGAFQYHLPRRWLLLLRHEWLDFRRSERFIDREARRC